MDILNVPIAETEMDTQITIDNYINHWWHRSLVIYGARYGSHCV